MLRRHLKALSEVMLRNVTGSALHSFGAATLKDLSSKLLSILPSGKLGIGPVLERKEYRGCSSTVIKSQI